MSNSDNFDFDDNLFDDDDDSFGSFDEGFDEDNMDSFADTDDSSSFFDEEEPVAAGGGGPNRTFVVLAALMIVLFLVGLGVILFLATRNRGPSEIDITRTAIAEINGTRIADITNTAVQAQIFVNLTATQDTLNVIQTQTEAARPTDSPTPSPTETLPPSPTIEITNTPEGGVGQEDLAATFAAATGIALTGTAQNQPTLSGPGTLSANDVLLTATALFLTLNPQTPGPGTEVAITPLPAGQTPIGTFPTPRPNQLPQTGLFDGFASGQGMGTLALLTIGLVGIIVISRRLRRPR